MTERATCADRSKRCVAIAVMASSQSLTDSRASAWLRQQFAAYVAGDRERAATDPVACQRLADRSEVFAAVAARSRELLERGRLVVKGETMKCSFCSEP